ncbi:MAG: AI-2E family transporter [Hyphomonadaceae bacterium]|nr:AI-2E family transporter [Hyphomonadaceae bacterium]
MTLAARAALSIIATGVVVAGLSYFKEALVQFALAMLLYIGIDGMARWMHRRIPLLPRLLALPIAIVLVLALCGWLGWFMVDNAGDFTGDFDAYASRLDTLVAQGWAQLHIPGEPVTVSGVLSNADVGALLGQIVRGVQGVAADALFILIYLGFIFAAAANFSQKLDQIFRKQSHREHARSVMSEMRSAMEKYLWVTTLLGAVTSVFIYGALYFLELPNPLFWSVLIFLLSFIPTIGPLLATALPTLFALVSFDTLYPVAGVLGAVGVSQFIVGNFLQPRITGDSLNLSALVILLALALWGALWGIAGAFLAAPLTVLLMTLLSQFDDVRWIAVLLSADGKPKTFSRAEETESSS